MIQVSDQAANVLKEALTQSGVEEGQALRLQAQEGGFGLEVDTPREDDQIINHQEAPLLLIDSGANASITDSVGDALIDLEQDQQGARLVIRPLSAE